MKTFNKIAIVILFAMITAFAANAQNTRSDKKAARLAEIKNLVESRNFVFDANYVNPSRGSGRALTTDYDLTITKDTIIAYLPYFGQAYVAPPYGSTEGGIKFTNTDFTYIEKAGKKGGWNITIKPNKKNISDSRDVQSMYLTISPDGYASLQVISSNRDPISFNGTIDKRPDVKK